MMTLQILWLFMTGLGFGLGMEVLLDGNNDQHYVKRGMDLDLICGNLSATNISLVIWKKPGNKIVPGGINSPSMLEAADDNSLRLLNVSLSNSGTYSCEAFSFGNLEFSASLNLVIRDVPDPPVNVTLLSISGDSLVASWNFGDNHNSLITLHTLLMYDGPQVVVQTNVSAPLKNYTFVGLKPYRCYSLLVRALNDVGLSELTKPVHALTLPSRPDFRPPVNIYNTSQDTVIVLLDFSKLVLPAGFGTINDSVCGDTATQLQFLLQGPLSTMAVFVSTIHPTVLVRKEIHPVQGSFNHVIFIRELHPFTQYNLSFAFENGRFRGPLTQKLVSTKEGLPHAPQINQGLSTNQSVTFYWSDSDDPQGKVVGYVVELYRCGVSETMEPKESMRLHKQQIGPIKREYTFDNLDANACYAVRVAAGTQVGFGSFSRLLQVYTDLPSPKPPDLISADFLDTNDILLNWTCSGACLSPVSKVHYTVCWTFLPIKTEPKCLATQTINANHQVFCNCGNGQFQTTVIPWSIVQHARSTQAVFTVRSVLRRPSCLGATSCEKSSLDSNRVVLDLSSAPAAWLVKTHPMSGFKLDSTAIGGIVAITLLIFLSVTLAACFASRLRCMFLLCHRSLMYGRSVENPTKYRRAVPLRLNKANYQPIARADLRAYVASAHANDDAAFQAEFEDIEQNVASDCTTNVARLPENVNKNRYSNVLAYDHTRVILREVGHKSDYINANYVDGYYRRSAYIATQGPTPSTFDDFWLMAWEQNCNVIVMISNFIERGRRKCDKYWPSSGQQTYGNISVRMISETIRAFFTIRVFLIRHVRCKRNSKDRLVYHYQYTDWRDFDVPPSPLPVLKFVEASIAHWSLDKGPIIVHCSAGVGRTGTYICIESLIRQLQSEHVVSIRGFLEHIRQQRMKLVQTEQQYTFIHDALREYVLYPCHTIRVPHFRDYLHHLRQLDSTGRSNLEKQFDMCIESHGDSAEMSRSRTLSTVSRRGSSFVYGTTDVLGINSSALHGYHMLSEYIVARHPLAGTETEFWKMVWDENSSIIVCLSGPELPPFWPNKPNEVRTIGWLHVSYAGSTIYQDRLIRYEFLLTSDREDYALACTLWRFDGWPSVELDTESERTLADTLLDLIAHVVEEDENEDGDDGDGDDRDDLCHRSTGPIVVVDNSGGNRVGTFCALRILINQLTHENVLDVYFVSKMLCFQRPRMFQSHRDLEFIYSLLEHYLTRESSLTDHLPMHHAQPDQNGGHSIGHTTMVASSGHGTITSMLGLSSPTRRDPQSHQRKRTKMALHSRFGSKPRGRVGRHAVTSCATNNCSGSALFNLTSCTTHSLDQVSLLRPGTELPLENCPCRPSTPAMTPGDPSSTTETSAPATMDASESGIALNMVDDADAPSSNVLIGQNSGLDNLTHSWSDVSAGTHRQSFTFPTAERQDTASYRHSVHSFPSSIDV